MKVTKTTTVEASWPVPDAGITPPPPFLQKIADEIATIPGLFLRCTIHYEPPVAVSSSDRTLIEPARFWIKETFEEEDGE